MKTIKIIDIFYGKYDKLPKKVKALDEIWIYDEIAGCHKNKDCVRLYKRLDEFYTLSDWLNFEVEILDEEDEFEDIEELDNLYPFYNYFIVMNKLIKNQKKIIDKLKEE